jgi:regulator of protease activity HflC (stomatin/prohibitin superfamily)
MGFLILALVLSALLTLGSKDRWQQGNKVDVGAFATTFLRFALVLVVVIVGLGGLVRSLVVVPAGHRGVVFNRLKGVRQQALGEGFNMVLPVIEQAYLMDVRVQKDSHDASAASKDLQIVHTRVALNFHPDPSLVAAIYQEVGLEFSDRVIQPAIQEAVKATTARFTAEELVTRREDVKTLIRDLVEKQVTPFHIKVDELYITDFEFSKQFAEAIETKQIAEQQALKAKRDLDRIKIEADQKIASARAEAESLKMQREAITPGLIQLRQVETQKLAIEKWDGKMPSVMMGSSATPLLDLNGLKAR